MSKTEPTFKPLPHSFHENLRKRLIHGENICSGCVKPLCSCSGATRANACFLPGERAWIEQHAQHRIGLEAEFRGTSKTGFPVSGDCNYLRDNRCSLGIYKPWDCLSFPIQPLLDTNGKLQMTFAENCSLVEELPDSWIRERWNGWLYIAANVDPAWLEWYCGVPAHE